MKLTARLTSGTICFESNESVCAALQDGRITDATLLHPEDGGTPVSVKQHFENSGQAAVLVGLVSPRDDAAHKPMRASWGWVHVTTVGPLFMMAGFLLPCVQWSGSVWSGVDIAMAGSLGTLGWLSPLGALLVLGMNLTGRCQRRDQVIAALVALTPFVFFLLATFQGPAGLLLFRSGAWLTIIAAGLVVFSPCRRKPAASAPPDV